jgi:hypothetical protein
MDASPLLKFDPIALKEMNSVSLLKRIDTKFLTTESKLLEVLPFLNNDYRILEIEDNRLMNYATLYFDTEDLKSYFEHHNGKAKRQKIRMRKYIDSDLCFLEIKEKQNSGMTNKTRCTIGDLETTLSEKSKEFIKKATNKDLVLKPVLYNYFQRFTLVNTQRSERVTIDSCLSYKTNDTTKALQNIVVIEVKQEKQNVQTPIYKALKVTKIRTSSFSKYCIGVASLVNGVKANRFKELNLKINKLTN